MSEYAVAYRADDQPLGKNDFTGAQRAGERYYNTLLHAFGLGPFSYDEGSGALAAETGSLEQAHRLMNNLSLLKLIMYIG